MLQIIFYPVVIILHLHSQLFSLMILLLIREKQVGIIPHKCQPEIRLCSQAILTARYHRREAIGLHGGLQVVK